MRRMITGKDAQLFKNVAADGNKTVVSGDLNVNGNIMQNGQPFAGGSKIYKHTLSGIGVGTDATTSNANSRIIIYSTSSDLIDDLYKLQYNTENWLRADYVPDITRDQRTIYQILTTSFATTQYKLYIVYVTSNTNNPIDHTEISTGNYTDTVEEI